MCIRDRGPDGLAQIVEDGFGALRLCLCGHVTATDRSPLRFRTLYTVSGSGPWFSLAASSSAQARTLGFITRNQSGGTRLMEMHPG